MPTDENVKSGRISTSSGITTETSTTGKSSTSIDSSTSSSALTNRKQSHSQNREKRERRSPSFPHNLRRPSDPKTNRLLRAFLAALLGLTQVPLWTAYYVPRFTRPHPQWSWRHAVMVRILRYYIYHIAMLEYSPCLSLSPGLERDRFVVMQRARKEMYVGVAAASKGVDAKGKIDVVEAGLVGGTWYPAPLVGPSGVHGGSAGQGDVLAATIRTTGPVALHFHGGGYMLGAGRILDAGFGARLLIKHAGVSHVLCPQYRLASSSNYDNQSSSPSSSSSSPGRFPAALQDAITSYAYLTDTLKIEPHQIVLSGDSAGGNLVLALLRYITDHGPAIGLESPSCAWLWSPWVDIANSFDALAIDASFNSNTDILVGDLLAWGARAYCGGGSQRFTTTTNATSHQEEQEYEHEQEHEHEQQQHSSNLQHDPENPYISPLRHPFPTRTPIWIQTGGAEIFCFDNVKFAEQMKSVKGNQVELWIERRAIHDVCLLGTLTGFGDEARSAASRAKEFMHARKIKG